MKDWPFGFRKACEAPRTVGRKQSISIQLQCTDYDYARPFVRAITHENFLQSQFRAVESSTAEQNDTLIYMQGNELPLCFSTKLCTLFSRGLSWHNRGCATILSSFRFI